MFLSAVFFVLSAPPVFAGEWANRGQTCTQYCASTGRSCITTYDTGGTGQTVGGSCSSSFTQSCNYAYPDQICCGCQGAPRTPRDPCARWIPQGWTQYCSSQNICISPQYDCNTAATCNGRTWVCPTGYRINCGPPITCQSTATPTPRPSVCVPDTIRNVCSTTSCSL